MLFWNIIACSPQLPPIQIADFQPNIVVAENIVPIVLTGTNFHSEPFIRSQNEIEFASGWLLTLIHEDGERIEIDEIRWKNPEQVEFETPSELSPGFYQLKLSAPDGREAEAEQVLTVTPTALAAAKWISFESEYQTEEWALAQIQAVDIDGIPHAEAAYVKITASEPLQFRELLDAQVTTNNGVEGYLSQSGLGLLAFTSEVPSSVDLTVELVPNLGTVDRIGISFVTGSAAQAAVNIGSVTELTAGESLPVFIQLIDDTGNPTAGEQRYLRIVDSCSGTTEFVDVLDSAFVELLPTKACDVSYVDVLDAQSGLSLGQSSAFEVKAAAPSQLNIQNIQNLVQTGQALELVVQLTDAYDNVVHDTLDQINESNLPSELLSLSCSAFSQGLSLCEAQFQSVLEGYRLYIETIDGIGGFSPFLTVEPGPAASMNIQSQPNPVVAGEDVDLYIELFDAYGNPLTTASNTAISIKKDQEVLNCSSLVPIGVEQLRLRCQLTEAGRQELTAQYFTVLEVFDIDVMAGSLASGIPLSPPSQTTAGSSLTLQAEGRDAYGNIVENPSPGNIELSIDGQIYTTTIDSNGLATWNWTPTIARTYQPEIIYQGQRVGDFPTITVGASTATELAIELERTWTLVGESIEGDVFFVDAYGNRANETMPIQVIRQSDELVLYQGAVTNQYTLSYTPNQKMASEQLRVVSDAYPVALSSSFDVLDDCGFETLSMLTLANQSDSIVCMDENPITVNLSTSGSYVHYSTGLGWTRTTQPSFNIDVREDFQVLEVLTRDENLCYNTISLDVFGAPDRIYPYGPIDIGLSDTQLDPINTPSSNIQISAYRCDGSPAAFQRLYLRATGGLLASNGSSLSATGNGLSFSLDGLGEGSLLLDSRNIDSRGLAELLVATETQQAGGTTEIEFRNYQQPPYVIDLSWTENNGVPVRTDVSFSIDMDTTQAILTQAPLTLLGSLAFLPADIFWLDNRTLRVEWPELDINEGPFSIWIDPILSSTDGIFLEGVPLVPGSPFEASFTYSGPALSTSTCSASAYTFRPDGDDGAGIEADQILISSSFNAAPAFVRWTITGENRTVVKVFEGGNNAHAEEFDGRDEWGIILPNGQYTLTLEPLHADYSAGGSCVLNFEIDNDIWDPFTP